MTRSSRTVYKNSECFDAKFKKVAQNYKKIDPQYQSKINGILRAYVPSAPTIETDGKWGPDTDAALSTIQSNLKLQPFSNEESLKQLDDVLEKSIYNPSSSVSAASALESASSLVSLSNNLQKFFLLKKETQWSAPELIIKFYEGVLLYATNIQSLLKSFEGNSLIKERVDTLKDLMQKTVERTLLKIDAAKKLQAAQSSNQDTSPMIETLGKQGDPNFFRILIDNSYAIQTILQQNNKIASTKN